MNTTKTRGRKGLTFIQIIFLTQKIIELENQALVIDDAAMQKEILKGNFKLRISNKMKNPFKIEKYAQEPVAYFLHKNRDFLQRLYSKKDQFEKKDIYEFQGHLKYVAGESPEGKRRITRLKNKRENSLNKLGITIGEKKQGWFTRKEKNLAEIPESAQTKTPNENDASQKISPNRSNSNIPQNTQQVQLNISGFATQQPTNTQTTSRARSSIPLKKDQPKRKRGEIELLSELEQAQLLDRAINQLDQEIQDDQQIKEIALLYERRRAHHKFKTARNQNGLAPQQDHHNKSFDIREIHQQQPRMLNVNKSMERMGYSSNYKIEVEQFSQTQYPDKSPVQQKFNDNVLFNRLKDPSQRTYQRIFALTQNNRQSANTTAHDLHSINKYASNYQPTSPSQITKPFNEQQYLPLIRNSSETFQNPSKSILNSRLSRNRSLLQGKTTASRIHNQSVITESDTKAQTHRQIDKIIKHCQKMTNDTHFNLNRLQADIESQEQLNTDFDMLVETFKGLEGIDFKVLQTMYHYRKLDQLERQEESRGVCLEYKSGVMDPSRYVAKMERSTHGKRTKSVI